jgi:GT2 family glycosyltransferase
VTSSAPFSVAVALVVYGQSDATIARMLDQLESLECKPLPVYLVANEPERSLRHFGSRATVLEPLSNLGFCGGVNLAARAVDESAHSHLLLVNLDVELLAGDLIARLAEVFSIRPDCAFASPGIVFWPDTSLVWYRGGRIVRPIWTARQPGIGRPWPATSRGAVRTDYFSGCCALIDLASFLRVGGFDETLFMYYDEVELATRVAREESKFCYLLDEPLVAHEKPGRKFNENESYYHARNSRWLLGRYERGWHYVVGRIGQYLLMPLQLTRCDSRASRAAYLRGFRAKG